MIEHISHSSMTDADSCMSMYHAKRVAGDRVPSFPSGPRDIGILAHSYIEAFFKGEGFLDALIEQDHTTEHAEAMAVFTGWKRRFNIPEENWLYTERKGECNVEGVPVPIIGYDDFVYVDGPTHVLRDFKTGWGTEVYEAYSFQGDLACLRYEQEFSGIPLASEVEFVRRGIVSERRIWSPALRAATIDRVKALWEKIQAAVSTDVWGATPGKHCTFCPIIAECAKGQRVQKAGLVVADEPSALDALRNIALYEEAISLLKSSLKPYVDAHGPVSAGEGNYDFGARYNVSDGALSFENPQAVIDIVGLDSLGKSLKIDGKIKAGAAVYSDPRVQHLIKRGKPTSRFYVGKNKLEESE
jgi:hypothetical protein